MGLEVDLVLDARAELAEGPVWDQSGGQLVWVDLLAGAVHRFDPASGDDRALDVGQPVGAVALRRSGGYVAAVRDGIALLGESGEPVIVAPVETDVAFSRFNDGKCDPAGRFWAGTSRMEGPPGGTLYRIDPDHSVTPVVTGLLLSNGLGWSLDGTAMYLIDSLAGSLDVFDFVPETGIPAGRRSLVRFDPSEGLPDGMTVDGDGFLWVALYGGGAVRRYSPAGKLDLVIELPVSQVTSCTFGGTDLRELYITTAAQHLSRRRRLAEPSAGGIFRCRPGAVGLPADTFAG